MRKLASIDFTITEAQLLFLATIPDSLLGEYFNRVILRFARSRHWTANLFVGYQGFEIGIIESDLSKVRLWDIDWVDHVIPSSRGGKAELSNGICDSSFFNSKKRNNSVGNVYLFDEGRPTSAFY